MTDQIRNRGIALSLTAALAACSTGDGTNGSNDNGEQAAHEISASNAEVQAVSPFPNALAGEEWARPAGAVGMPDKMFRRLETPGQLDKATGRYGAVFGSYVEGGKTGRYSWVVDSAPVAFETPRAKGDEHLGRPAQARPVMAPSILARMQGSSSGDLVPVVVTLKTKLATRLDDAELSPLATLDAFKQPTKDQIVAGRTSRIDARKGEAAGHQGALKSWLVEHGVPAASIGDFWAVNALSATVPASLVPALAQHPDVARVELDHQLSSTGSTTWDGQNVNASSGLNAGLYTSNGYLGNRVNPKTNFPISIGVLDFFFADDHPVFQHSPGVSKIVGEFSCKNNQPCTGGLPVPSATDDVHGSWCASAAAAAAMNGQISGTTAQKRDRTGVAEQTELTFVSTGAISDTIRGLQQAVTWDADVVTESFGGGDGVCDGFNSGWESAVYSAHQAGVLVVGSAGNDGHPAGACKLTGLSEVPSQFVAGATNDPGSGAYSSVGIADFSSGGGIDVTIGGSSFPRAFTGVDALVPGHWEFAAGKSGAFNSVGGTSFSAPQVAGVAALFKDWMIGQGFATQANMPGVLFANLLAMTDRANGTTRLTSGFDPIWGGGRLQARYFLQPDHPSGLWRWETATYSLTKGAHVQHLVAGAGNEPAGIKTFKVYAVFFEQDGSDVADIDVTVYDKGCGAGRTQLGSDISRDMKSMVSIGSAGAGKDVCVDLYGFHVPQNETRDVVLVAYYTDQTSMR